MPDTQKKSASLYSAFKEIINPQKLKPATQTITNGDMNSIILQINEMMRKLYNKAFSNVLELKNLKVSDTMAVKKTVTAENVIADKLLQAKTINSETVMASEAKATTIYENGVSLKNKYVSADDLKAFKIYTMADLGITGNTTLNAVCKALSAKQSVNPWMFLYGQGTLSGGITDLPEGYGLLTVTQIGFRFVVEYKASKIYFRVENTSGMAGMTPDKFARVNPT
jgi:hypothetical protein